MKDSSVNELTDLLQALQLSIDQTQCFKTKWSIIKTKLTTLDTHLSDLSNNQSQLCVDLINSLQATLSSTLSLSTLCNTPSPPDGKLKTQNDIASISSKLDCLVNDIKVVNKSRVLQDSVPLPTSSSSRTGEFLNLITRLQIGTMLSKNAVLDSLLGLLNEEDKNVVIAVGQGAVPVLVRLLDSNSSLEVKEKTVSCIARIAVIDSGRRVLLDEGLPLLNNLLRVLESGSVFAKEKSCLALLGLSNTKENARAIGCRGGISSLLEICQAGTPGSQAMAAGVLRNLAVFKEIKENFVEENAIEILLCLANSGTSLAQENAIGCLCNLIVDNDDDDDDSIKMAICRNGGIVTLKNYWDSDPTVQSLEVSVTMLSALATSPLISDTLVSNGFLNRVVGVLGCGVLGVRIAAAQAVYDLGYNNKTRKELGEIGCISPLVRMLEGKSVEEKQAAAKALSNLLVYAPNRRIFRKDEKGIVNAVQLLDPVVVNLDKRYPIRILEPLVHSKKCRKQITKAGACVHLQKLVDMDVEGAKKLLVNVSGRKMWGVFSRH